MFDKKKEFKSLHDIVLGFDDARVIECSIVFLKEGSVIHEIKTCHVDPNEFLKRVINGLSVLRSFCKEDQLERFLPDWMHPNGLFFLNGTIYSPSS